MPAVYVVDIEWPLSGIEVGKNFEASVRVRNEDDVAGGPAGNHYVQCKIIKNGVDQDSGRSADFDPDTEPLVGVPLNAPSESKHRLIAELFPSAGGASIASDEESEIKITAGGPPKRLAIETITEIVE